MGITPVGFAFVLRALHCFVPNFATLVASTLKHLSPIFGLIGVYLIFPCPFWLGIGLGGLVSCPASYEALLGDFSLLGLLNSLHHGGGAAPGYFGAQYQI